MACSTLESQTRVTSCDALTAVTCANTLTMAKTKKTSFKKHLTDGILIVFSVLFALTINKIADNHQTNKRKEFALESIHKELARNAEIITEWKAKHSEIAKRLNALSEGENDSLKAELTKRAFLDLGLLTNNESLINSILTNTAWQTANSTGIISEFDFETTQKLTYVYSMQSVLTDRTVMKILDFYFDMEAHKMENIDAILIQFRLRFGELIGQEYLLESLYADAIKSTE